MGVTKVQYPMGAYCNEACSYSRGIQTTQHRDDWRVRMTSLYLVGLRHFATYRPTMKDSAIDDNIAVLFVQD